MNNYKENLAVSQSKFNGNVELIYDKFYDNYKQDFWFVDYNNEIYYYCSDCGKTYDNAYVYDHSTQSQSELDIFNRVYLKTYHCPCCKNLNKKASHGLNKEIDYRSQIFIEKKDNTTFLKLRKIKKQVIFNKNSKMFFILNFVTKLTFNINTGMTYFTCYKRNKNKISNKIFKNITYMPDCLPFSLTQEECDILSTKLYELKNDLYNYTLPPIYNYKILTTYIKVLTSFNRYPSFNSTIRNYLIDQKDARKYFKANGDYNINNLLDFLNIPNTKFNKKELSNVKASFVLAHKINIIKTGYIKKPDNLRKVFYSNNATSAFASEFFKCYIEYYGENLAVNKFIKTLEKDHFILNDICNMYGILKKYEESNKDYKLDFDITDSFKRIHDNFSRQVNQMKIENIYLTYPDAINSLEYDTNLLHIYPVKCTYELIEIGSIMDICVASYRERAIKKDCYILVGRNKKTNKPEVCIEIINNKKLIQLKYINNRIVPPNYKKIFIDWAKANKIDCKDCHDYKDMVKMTEESYKEYLREVYKYGDRHYHNNNLNVLLEDYDIEYNNVENNY